MIVDHHVDTPGIAIVRSSRPWARTLHRYVVDHGGAIVKTRPLEERQAIEDEYDILVVDDISSFLNNHIVDELHRRGRRVLGVYDLSESAPGDDAGRQRLLRIGVDGVIEANATPEEFVRTIQNLAPPLEERLRLAAAQQAFENVDGLDDFGFGNPEINGFTGTAIPQKPAQNAPRRRGHITAVLGTGGGVGATEVAIELARALGKRGERTVLVDGDDVAPSIAQRLNLPLHPNIRTAVDVVEHGSGRLSECLIGVASGMETLVGLPHPRNWVELRGTDMTALIEELSRGRPHIVVNTSSSIEDLASMGGTDRFAMTRAAVEEADLIVLVCPPTPMGVARLIDKVAELAEFTEGKPIQVVVNRTPKGNYRRNEIAREIERNFAPAGIHFLPQDENIEKAAWEGILTTRGDFSKSVASGIATTIPRVAMGSGRRGKPGRPPRR